MKFISRSKVKEEQDDASRKQISNDLPQQWLWRQAGCYSLAVALGEIHIQISVLRCL